MQAAFQKLYRCLKPGGKLLFRDYGRYDEAQLRFKNSALMQDNFYVRQDGTCAYYFEVEELRQMLTGIMDDPVRGFEVEECYAIRRQYANREQKKVRYRVWIHGKFRKPMDVSSPAVV